MDGLHEVPATPADMARRIIAVNLHMARTFPELGPPTGTQEAALLVAEVMLELLAAGEAALINLDRTPIDKVSVAADMLRAAVAKAKGRTP